MSNLKGDLFFALALARLLENKCESLTDLTDKMILMAWRKLIQNLQEKMHREEIAKFVQSYSPEQLEDQKPVKGKLLKFMKIIMKIMMVIIINLNYMTPQSSQGDLKITDTNSGKSMGIQLKHLKTKTILNLL